MDRPWKGRPAEPTLAIFIHAGAGYHSLANEKAHLGACSDAARIAMKFLKGGATAVEAVEVAIKYLEDNEITNAGYGSNLSINGIVECDATIVDHLGRSGACGAVSNIKNPISLAKLILDKSNRPLSLRRVPPNILVGIGAREFANEHGMPSTPSDHLVSRNAKDRFLRWSEDMKKVQSTTPPLEEGTTSRDRSPFYDQPPSQAGTPRARDHASAILTGTWNEGQPDSPQPDTMTPSEDSSPKAAHYHSSWTGSSASSDTMGQSQVATESDSFATAISSHGLARRGSGQESPSKRPRLTNIGDGDMLQTRVASPNVNAETAREEPNGLREDTETVFDVAMDGTLPPCSKQDADNTTVPNDEDLVTDTIGAIAVDQLGHIAAGSSSGGIGMKHRGRIGPAALVGIGTAVLPTDADDVDDVSVAAVVSGTGEHMATTVAAHTCAERLYYSIRRRSGARIKTEYDESRIMHSMVADDFMNHPGVKNQNSKGAIGVMAVKKTRNGYYFHFAHNTDSFALASMSSCDKEPKCVMSRLCETTNVTHGARKIRID